VNSDYAVFQVPTKAVVEVSRYEALAKFIAVHLIDSAVTRKSMCSRKEEKELQKSRAKLERAHRLGEKMLKTPIEGIHKSMGIVRVAAAQDGQ
jgi:hypothetical protein